jgi:metallo-beta-lactamase family protein
MKIHFQGAAQTTTGSMHLLDFGSKKILLDCGMYQGNRKKAFEKNRNFPFDATSIDAVVLSHAHIDHSGNLPSLVKRGYKGPIYATPATIDLCRIMLKDSAHIQEKDVFYVNKKRKKKGQKPFEPLYVQQDAEAALDQLRSLSYDQPLDLIDGVKLTFRDAGHILGSAISVFDIEENGAKKRLLFTGDLGRSGMPILRDPQVVNDVDYLITESTYGNRTHPAREDVEKTLLELCKKVLKRGSKLIIPAFSVGRTQQILYFLHELWAAKQLEEIPVYVDSPLSTKATEVHDRHAECYDEEMRDLILHREDPFTMRRVRFTASVEESKALNVMKGPVIVISSSGMCEAGRILHHLKCSVGDDRNIILIVGYQAEHTMGRRLVEHKPDIRIFGETYKLRAEVHSIQALSAHADRNEMLAYFKAMGPEVKKAFVVHGEPEQQKPFAEALSKLGAQEVIIPAPGQIEEI